MESVCARFVVAAPILVELVDKLKATKYSPGVIDTFTGTDTGRTAGEYTGAPAELDAYEYVVWVEPDDKLDSVEPLRVKIAAYADKAIPMVFDAAEEPPDQDTSASRRLAVTGQSTGRYCTLIEPWPGAETAVRIPEGQIILVKGLA